LNGFELGGFANVLKGNMQGAQIAGFANVNGGSTSGLQMAGFANVNQKKTEGFQIAGFANIVSDSSQAFQLAGFTNLTTGASSGGQIAGFMNLNNGNIEGFQWAGFANICNKKVHGVQLSGSYNMSADTLTGVQTAGFMNLAGNHVRGTQISGFLNVAKSLSGLQLGVINLCDSLEQGATIGLLSFVRKGGLFMLEASADETFYANLLLKTGSRSFYNVLGASARPAGEFYWGFTYGIGTELKQTGKLRINLDATATQVNKNNLWSNHLNLLSRIKLGFAWQAKKRFAIAAGPDFNVLTIYKQNTGELMNMPTVAPYSVYDEEHQNTRVMMWPGAHVSIRF
jgi:hypothetical protein